MKPLAILAAALAALSLAAAPAPAPAQDFAWPVLRVIDGDTILVDASADMPARLAEVRVRLRGVDTPEPGDRAGCAAERAAAAEATAFVRAALGAAGTIVVRDPDWGRWGGRVVAEVLLDGIPLSAMLRANEHAREMTGGRRPDWCATLAPVDAAATDGGSVRERVDALLAGMDREEEAPAAPAAPADLRAEIERRVLDPCLRAGIRAAGLDRTLKEDAALRMMKRELAAQLRAVSDGVAALAAGQTRAARAGIYATNLALCIDELTGSL